MKKTLLLTLTAAIIILSGCTSDKSTDNNSELIVNIPTPSTTEPASETDICVHPETGEEMTLEKAREVSQRTSLCREQLKDFAFCNDVTGTWWIDRKNDKEGCNPACVVDIKTKNVEVNWRCTGLKTE